MQLRKQFTLNELRPALAGGPDPVCLNLRLPVGVTWAAGKVLALSTIAARAEVRTLTVTGTPTGCKFVFTYTTGSKVYTATTANLVTALASLAEVRAALESIFGVGNVAVTGTPGDTYTCTFQNALDKVDVSGTFAVTATFTAGTSPAAAWSRTTQGSAGAGQAVAYDDGGSNGAATAKALLRHDYTSDAQGGVITEFGETLSPYSPPCFVAGLFRVGDLTGLDANGAADLGVLYGPVTDSNALLKLF